MRALWALAVCSLLGQSNNFAAEYFVAPQGRQDNPGTRQKPWNLPQANAAAKPGDVITFLPGDYEGALEPEASGEKDKPIIFRGSTTGIARLIGGQAGNGQLLCMRLKDKQYLTIEDLELRPRAGGWLAMEGCRHVRLARLRMREGTRYYTLASVRNCHYCRFENLDLARALQRDANGHVTGDMLSIFGSSHNVITGCRFAQCGHGPFTTWPDATYNVIRHCVFDCRWGRNFSLFTSPHTLMEYCLITNALHGSGSADGRAKLFIWEGIFRHNLIYRNWYQPLTIHAYKYEDMDPFGMINSRIYHNTFYGNYESGFEMSDIAPQPNPHMVRGNILQNNVFAGNDPGGDGVQLNLGGNISPDNLFVHNLFWAGKPKMPCIKYVWPDPIPARPQSQLRTPEEANQQLPAQFKGNREGNPLFVKEPQDDYRLRPGSPAIDAGAPLTTTTASGTSHIIPVADARPFYDGYGIPGEQGDLVFIGPRKQRARVLHVDTQASTLQLDRKITFRKGEAVTLPYVGTAPDIGAYEFGAEKQPWHVRPHPSPALRMLTLATAQQTMIRIDFEEESLENWFYWWYAHRQRNTLARLDETTAAQGRQSWRIYATEDNATLSCLIRPPEWDIDRFPYVRFSYRIPPGTPVGLRLEAMASEKRGSNVYIGGTATRNNGGNPDLNRVLLLDDNQWHTAQADVRWIREIYPDIKLLRSFWFYTNANAKRGQEFWLDDFQIEPN